MDIFSDDFDLDVELAQDKGGARLKDIRNALQEGLTEVRRSMDRGLPSEEYKQAQALQKAFEAAATAVDGLWNERHAH